MRYHFAAVAAIVLVLSGGCVWKSDYTARLADIDGLKKDKAGLEEKSAAQEKEIGTLKGNIDDLTRQKTQLEKEKAVLTQENDTIRSALAATKDQLAKEVVMLKGFLSDNEKRIAALGQQVAERDRQIADLTSQVAQLQQEKAKAIEEREKAIAHMKNTYESLVGELKQEIKEGEIQITQLKDKLTVNMVDKVLFDSGSAAIKPKGQKVLDRVAEILKTVTDRQIKVEGHTDNVPISSALAERFPTNWELSTARATTVVRYLQGRGINASLLSAEGFSEYRPVAPNDTPENKSKNRRIEIVLLPLDALKAAE